jgi:AcrR family transcriptional regulator
MTRREAILGAAKSLFAVNGYSGTPTARIAREAGVSEGTLFHYYKTKEDLFLWAVSEVTDDLYDMLWTAVKGNPTGWQAVAAYIGTYIRFAEDRPLDHRFLVQSCPRFSPASVSATHASAVDGMFVRIVELLSTCIEQGREDGTIKGFGPGQTAKLIHCMLVCACAGLEDGSCTGGEVVQTMTEAMERLLV